MGRKGRHLIGSLLVAVGLLIGLIALDGCKKKPEPAPPAAGEGVIVAEIVQKTCPVMGGAIQKDIFAEYKGKKVYFCCPPCKEKFEANPEEYVAKLPQFSK